MYDDIYWVILFVAIGVFSLMRFFVRDEKPIKYVVEAMIEVQQSDLPDEIAFTSKPLYLQAIQHDPYGRGAPYPPYVFCDDPNDAFLFDTLAAAETAAVFIAGRTLTLEQAVMLYAKRLEGESA